MRCDSFLPGLYPVLIRYQHKKSGYNNYPNYCHSCIGQQESEGNPAYKHDYHTYTKHHQSRRQVLGHNKGAYNCNRDHHVFGHQHEVVKLILKLPQNSCQVYHESQFGNI